MRDKMNKIIFLFLQLSYSAILHLESHCSIIANFFAIVYIYNFGCWTPLSLNAKVSLHVAFCKSNPNALNRRKGEKKVSLNNINSTKYMGQTSTISQ